MKKKEENLKQLLMALTEHRPLEVDYGDGIFDYPVWDSEINAYRDDTGIWGMKLLVEIAKGEVENTSLSVLTDLSKLKK